MVLPSRVLGFLDIFGDWDPSLMFVLAGAVGTHSLLYRLIVRRKSPLMDVKFHLPTRIRVDWNLLLGAALFGAGWGVGGLCPGPAVASLATAYPSVLLFFAAMLAGMLLHDGTSG